MVQGLLVSGSSSSVASETAMDVGGVVTPLTTDTGFEKDDELKLVTAASSLLLTLFLRTPVNLVTQGFSVRNSLLGEYSENPAQLRARPFQR